MKIIETAKDPRVEVKVYALDSKEAVDGAMHLALDVYADTIDGLKQRRLRGGAA